MQRLASLVILKNEESLKLMKLFHLSVFVSDVYTKKKAKKKSNHTLLSHCWGNSQCWFLELAVFLKRKQINMMLTKLFCIFSNMFIIGSSLSCQLQTSALLSPTLTHWKKANFTRRPTMYLGCCSTSTTDTISLSSSLALTLDPKCRICIKIQIPSAGQCRDLGIPFISWSHIRIGSQCIPLIKKWASTQASRGDSQANSLRDSQRYFPCYCLFSWIWQAECI